MAANSKETPDSDLSNLEKLVSQDLIVSTEKTQFANSTDIVYTDIQTFSDKPFDQKNIPNWMTDRTIDIAENFCRSLWTELKTGKILRFSIRLIFIAPIPIFIWLVAVFQLWGFATNFDIWVSVSELIQLILPDDCEYPTTC